MVKISDFKALICDIEGTLCHINFVHKKLFPFVLDNIASYLDRTWDSAVTKEDIEGIISQSEKDLADGITGVVPVPRTSDADALKAAVIANVQWQMSIDRKIAALKNLQGHIWKAGYDNGELVSELFPDVLPSLRAAKDNGLKLYIYSSGSVGAQKLLFSHTVEGNVLDLFSGYFDTAVGHKREEQSYTNIAKEIGQEPKDCLFLTDIYEESVAADAAGMGTCAVRLL